MSDDVVDVASDPQSLGLHARLCFGLDQITNPVLTSAEQIRNGDRQEHLGHFAQDLRKGPAIEGARERRGDKTQPE